MQPVDAVVFENEPAAHTVQFSARLPSAYEPAGQAYRGDSVNGPPGHAYPAPHTSHTPSLSTSWYPGPHSSQSPACPVLHVQWVAPVSPTVDDPG